MSEERKKERGARQENGERHSTSKVKVKDLGLGHPGIWWCQEQNGTSEEVLDWDS